jgi:uncharacterized protein (TIGR01777 family)
VKIVIPGGSGQVGTILARAFVAEGREVVVLSRRHYAAPWRVVTWDGETLGDWAREIDGSDVVINLAGRSVNCRYTAANRREILESRVRSTRAVGLAIAAANRLPRVWLQASTATIYAHRFDADNDESSGVIGGNEPGVPETWRFSIEVADAWEAALNEAQVTATRKVALRSAIVMSPDRGGAFDTLCNLVRFGLGGQQASGRQFVSWIHHQDFVSALSWLIAHQEIAGPVNIAAPKPLANAEFMRELRRAAGMPIGLPPTSWMLEMGAVVLRTETELILKSRRVVPARLVESGFAFRYPSWPAAAVALWAERKSRR